MAYVKNNWVDREGTTRYFETVDDDGALILTPDYTQVTELGTPVNADNMNHIEEGIAAGSFTKYDSMATYAKNDLVTTIVDNELKVYKSLQDNNKNALEDSSCWEEVEFSGGSNAGLQLFDTILKDHVLTYEESKGLALQGTYVYKDAVAGSRYGYADFYNKCLEEYQNSITEQVYSKSNIVVVGSPTDNKGLLSGFSKTNYVTLPNHFLTAVANADTWEAEFRFTTGSSVTSPERQIIFHSGVGSSTSGVGGFLADIYQGKLRISYDTNNSSGSTTQITVSTYTEYFIKATFDYSTLTFSSYYKLNENDDWTLIDSLSVNGRLAESANWNATEMGNSSTETGYYLNGGSINLNNCYINIDGERWWSGVESLEYKKNSNGHLFYDIAEKEKIDELFTSTGMAWFYGVDTENERIFLPRNKYFAIKGTADITSVVGTGYGLGLTTGTHPNVYIAQNEIQSSDTHAVSIFNNGGTAKAVGTNAGSYISNSSDLTLGVTKDPYMSGLMALTSDVLQLDDSKYLYICVGNTTNYEGITDVVNQGMEILEQVNIGIESRVNLDATNLSNEGKSLIASYTMPSNKYVDLTLGASGTSYIAPANGWFYLDKVSTAASQGFKFHAVNDELGNKFIATTASQPIEGCSRPVSKGENIILWYTLAGATQYFRFYYAQGEV